MTTTNPAPSRREQLKARQEAETRRDTKRRTWSRIIGGVVTLIVIVVGYGLWTAIPEQGDTQRLAPDFTLTTTAGATVTLSDLRPSPVLIYFNEGAGCASCTMQMAEIEKNPGFAEAGIQVLPIVMNSAEQILPDMQQFGVTTPYLLDDGTVSKAYDVLDKLKDLIEMYEVASVGDLYSLLGITANHVDENWGWHDLSASAIVRSRDGFFLDLPKPENIRNDKF